MKIKYYLPLFFLIMLIPFFLLHIKDSSTKKAEFIESKSNLESRDTLKIFEIIDGEKKEYYSDFKIGKGQRAYFYEDSVRFNLNNGFYSLSVEMVGNEYTSRLWNSSCLSRHEMIIRKQRLQFEDFKLIHNGKLKGEYFCAADFKSNYSNQLEEVEIIGYFEMALVDEVEDRKLWE